MRLGDFWLSKRRGSQVWCITWFDPKTRQTVRRSTGHRDLDAAQEALAAHYIQHRRLDHERPSDVAIALLISRYIAAVPMRSADTAKAALKHWREFWADDPVSAMTTARQEAFHGWLEARMAPASAKRVLGVGRAALTRAYKRQELAALPAQAPYKAPERHREKVLSLPELRALWAAAAPVEHWRRYLWLALGTGARPEAILQLTADRIDFAAGVIQLATGDHGKKRRPTIPIAQSLKRELRTWGDGQLITFHGKPIARARETFKRLSKASGVECTAYTLRHTVATWLRQKNVPEWDIAGFLGHRPPGSATTARYAHYRPDYMRAAARAVDALLRAVAC